MTQPTQAEVFARANERLQTARAELSNARDALMTDYQPRDPLPEIGAEARVNVGLAIRRAKEMIDTARGELDDVAAWYRAQAEKE